MIIDICSQLKWWAENCDRCNGGCQVRGLLKDAAQEISSLRAQQEAEKNDPLTLDELRKMGGEPVYISGIAKAITYQGWEIVEKAICGTMYFRPLSRSLSIENYGSTWLAYRRKLEEVQK